MDKSLPSQTPIKLAVLICPQHSLASFGLVLDILRMVGNVRGGPQVSITRVSEDGQGVPHADGVLAVDGDASCLADMDAVLIPSLWDQGVAAAEAQPRLVRALADLPEHVLAAGLCSGVYLLAAAGRLEGRQATTHWLMAGDLSRRHPGIDVQAQRNLTHDGSVVCSGGSLAAIDGTLHVVQTLAGRTVARQLASLLVTDLSRGPQSRFVPSAPGRRHKDAQVQQVQDWIAAHSDQAITLQGLAEQVHLGVRTLQRRFQAATGMSPMLYQQQVRLSLAKDLLEDTRLSVAEVAARLGYLDRVAFGRLFKKHTGLTPAAYRQRQA